MLRFSTIQWMRRYLEIKSPLPERAGSNGHESAHDDEAGVLFAETEGKEVLIWERYVFFCAFHSLLHCSTLYLGNERTSRCLIYI